MSITGALFELPVGDAVARGRVLLDVLEPVRKRVVPDDSPLRFFQESVLIELLRPDGSAPPASLFCGREALEDGLWKITGKQPITPAELDFPIFLESVRGEIHVTRGEVVRPIDLTHQEYMEIDVMGTLTPAAAVPGIAAVLLDMPVVPGSRSAARIRRGLENSDLRLSPKAPPILAKLGDPVDEPYHVLSQRYGFDPARLLT